MSGCIEELFKYFNGKYDYIVADTSAFRLISDTLLVSKYADMFIYVVNANGIDKRQLVHAAQPLYTDKRLPNMSMLLNGVKSSKKAIDTAAVTILIRKKSYINIHKKISEVF